MQQSEQQIGYIPARYMRRIPHDILCADDYAILQLSVIENWELHENALRDIRGGF